MARSWRSTLFLGLALLASPARAVTISLAISAAPIQSGATISVDIVASGAASGEFVSAFDLGVNFDPAKLGYVKDSFVVGSALGSVVDTDFLDFTDSNGADVGSVLPYVVSLLDDQVLAALQNGASTILGQLQAPCALDDDRADGSRRSHLQQRRGPLDDEDDRHAARRRRPAPARQP